MLSRDGISGVSMRAVAREADVAVGLMNYYFDDKQGMIAAALERIGDPGLLNVDYLGLRLQLWSLASVDQRYAEINHNAQLRYLDGLQEFLSAARPDIDDADLRAGALLRCERIAFD